MAQKTDVFQDLYRYNAWANARVFAACRGVEPATLQGDALGTYGSLEETLKHLVSVEDAYLAMLQDKLPGGEGRDQYFAHDLPWFAERSSQLGQAYLALLPAFDDATLASPLRVPWFDFPLTKRDGLHQVLSHSGQHRAQVLSVLGARGAEVPDLDYVMMVEERVKGKA